MFYIPPFAFVLFALFDLALLVVAMRALVHRRDTLVTRIAVFGLVFVATFLVFELPPGDSLLLHVIFWPAIIAIAAARSVQLGLWLLVLGVPALAALTVWRAVRSHGYALPILAVGAALSIAVPLFVQSHLAGTAMRVRATEGMLEIRYAVSLLSSIRVTAGYRDAHGIACDRGGWPHLWSYRVNDWVPLPPESRYGGDTPAKVREICTRNSG